MEKDDADFLNKVDVLVNIIKDRLPQEIVDNVEARVELNTLKGMMQEKKKDILLNYNDYDDALKTFTDDCEDALYTEDLRIVNNAKQLIRKTDSLVAKYAQTLDSMTASLQAIIQIWAETDRIKNADAGTEEMLKADALMESMEKEADVPNPFDMAIK
mgnify:CR=1 FL=1